MPSTPGTRACLTDEPTAGHLSQPRGFSAPCAPLCLRRSPWLLFKAKNVGKSQQPTPRNPPTTPNRKEEQPFWRFQRHYLLVNSSVATHGVDNARLKQKGVLANTYTVLTVKDTSNNILPALWTKGLRCRVSLSSEAGAKIPTRAVCLNSAS